jgi:NAD+ diphosphatase
MNTMSPLPDRYASPLHLPYNTESLKKEFRPATPDADPGSDDPFWALLRGTELLVTAIGNPPDLPRGPLPETLTERESLFVGTWQESPCRAVRLGKDELVPDGLVAESLLAADSRLSLSLLSLGGVVGQILHWVRNSRFCSRCGGSTEWLSGEWGKRCTACGYSHFPHIHPCIIVLVRRPGEVLLTRKREWPQGRYSLVAGFLDFGECLEEAVVREVREETGVAVKNIRYVGSQSWPFPSQLMAGFVADYDGGEVQVQEKELEDARWFSVKDLPLMPPRRSIARYILDTFLL